MGARLRARARAVRAGLHGGRRWLPVAGRGIEVAILSMGNPTL